MRLSIFTHLDPSGRNQRSTWLNNLESLAVAADLFGFDTIWVGGHEPLLAGNNQEILQALWRLSAVTSRIMLGGRVAVRSPQELEQLQHEITLLTTVSGGRIRLALDLYANVTYPTPDAASQLTDRVVIEVLEHALTQTRFVTPMHGVASHVPIALIADHRLAASVGNQGQPLFLLADQTNNPSELIATYRQACEDQHGRLLCHCHITLAGFGRTTNAFERQIGGYDRTPAFGAITGTIEQIAAHLLVYQLATGADELLCEIAAPGTHQSEIVRAIELLGQKLLPYSSTHADDRASAVAAAHAELTHMLTTAASPRRKPRRPWAS
jgi:alkanesulfonate monooxygenase SsuD/methylene tetrahydromethanopterin reductase-like flavin-dependent oxidoreductase (luciferase family)